MGRWQTLLLIVALFSFFPNYVLAQIEAPNRTELFEEDTRTYRDQLDTDREQILTKDAVQAGKVSFDAPELRFQQDTNEMIGTGGILLSHDDVQLQAESARYNSETYDVVLDGNVLVSSPETTISCGSGVFNLESERGAFQDVEFTLEAGEYGIKTDELAKTSDTDYSLLSSIFSTCHCEDGTKPWSIGCSSAEIEQEGYAYLTDARLNFYDFPSFYLPYAIVPVKTERASGLLAPTYGVSNQNGFQFSQPVFMVLGDSADMMFTPFIETKTRQGMGVDYRQVFSRRHFMESRVVFSDESLRDGDARGTVTTGLYDPNFDEERFGGFYKHVWRSAPYVTIPSTFVTDLRYISDDLYLREMQDEDIGRYTDRFTTSKALFRSELGSYSSLELSGEFNQSLESDDDLIFQRLPETVFQSRRSFRPFGFNPYGVKLQTGLTASSVNFVRKEGYDGHRFDLNPTLEIPHYYKNYLRGQFHAGYHATSYSVSGSDPSGGDGVYDESRALPDFGYTLATGLERVYDVEPSGLMATMTGLGSENQNTSLRRVKHLIEPTISYAYTPEEDQSRVPFFDTLDNLRSRNLVHYGVRTSLLGRFLPVQGYNDPITELTPEVKDLPVIGSGRPLADLGDAFDLEMGAAGGGGRKGEIRELAFLSVSQVYDYEEDQEDVDPLRSAFSDVALDFGVFPTRSFGLLFESDFDAENNDFSSWTVGSHLRDDRGDVIRARYTYLENSTGQLVAGAEMVLTNRLRLGGYTRFDERASEFFENRAALRLTSACNCWNLDLGFSERLNPNESRGLVTFTFTGLGDITQNLGFGPRNQGTTTP